MEFSIHTHDGARPKMFERKLIIVQNATRFRIGSLQDLEAMVQYESINMIGL